MLYEKVCYMLLFGGFFAILAQSIPALQKPIGGAPLLDLNHDISAELFADLEELSRIVDISYCVGLTGTGIRKPFSCVSRCHEFEGFELVTTWNSGPFFSDSCGYIVISHPPSTPRIIVAFRGTYSITNTILDLSTMPQEYVPYPDDGDNGKGTKCPHCTVHAGFMASWRNTQEYVTPHLEELIGQYPEYQLILVGHSLGGAVAALASLEFHSRGWKPQVTTFGEPRVGNLALVQYFDKAFESQVNASSMYRRVTHAGDPVPLLPISEWGYKMHAGEIYISKPELPPMIADLRSCKGDKDPSCIAGVEALTKEPDSKDFEETLNTEKLRQLLKTNKGFLNVPARYRIWQLFFAHRDYFWRLGLCIPGGDPTDWYRNHHRIYDESRLMI